MLSVVLCVCLAHSSSYSSEKFVAAKQFFDSSKNKIRDLCKQGCVEHQELHLRLARRAANSQVHSFNVILNSISLLV